jgi:hypothetical protein
MKYKIAWNNSEMDLKYYRNNYILYNNAIT